MLFTKLTFQIKKSILFFGNVIGIVNAEKSFLEHEQRRCSTWITAGETRGKKMRRVPKPQSGLTIG